MMLNLRQQAGFSVTEVMVVAAIFTFAIAGFLSFFTAADRSSANEKAKMNATIRAELVSDVMFDEIRNLGSMTADPSSALLFARNDAIRFSSDLDADASLATSLGGLGLVSKIEIVTYCLDTACEKATDENVDIGEPTGDRIFRIVERYSRDPDGDIGIIPDPRPRVVARNVNSLNIEFYNSQMEVIPIHDEIGGLDFGQRQDANLVRLKLELVTDRVDKLQKDRAQTKNMTADGRFIIALNTAVQLANRLYVRKPNLQL